MNREAWKIIAKNDPNTSAATTLAIVSVRRRNIANGSNGEPAVDSTRTNSASSTVPAAIGSVVVPDVQPWSTLLLIPNTIAIKPLVTSTAPAMSTGPGAGRRVAGTAITIKAIKTSPT